MKRNTKAVCETCPYWDDDVFGPEFNHEDSGWTLGVCGRYPNEEQKWSINWCGEHPDFKLRDREEG